MWGRADLSLIVRRVASVRWHGFASRRGRGRTRTSDLWVMGPASYRPALPCVVPRLAVTKWWGRVRGIGRCRTPLSFFVLWYTVPRLAPPHDSRRAFQNVKRAGVPAIAPRATNGLVAECSPPRASRRRARSVRCRPNQPRPTPTSQVLRQPAGGHSPSPTTLVLAATRAGSLGVAAALPARTSDRVATCKTGDLVPAVTEIVGYATTYVACPARGSNPGPAD